MIIDEAELDMKPINGTAVNILDFKDDQCEKKSFLTPKVSHQLQYII